MTKSLYFIDGHFLPKPIKALVSPKFVATSEALTYDLKKIFGQCGDILTTDL